MGLGSPGWLDMHLSFNSILLNEFLPCQDEGTDPTWGKIVYTRCTWSIFPLARCNMIVDDILIVKVYYYYHAIFLIVFLNDFQESLA